MEKEEKEYQEHLKTLEEKNLLEKHTYNGKFNLGAALLDLESKIKTLYEVTHNQHNALEFLSAWYEQNAKTPIQDIDKPKIQLL